MIVIYYDKVMKDNDTSQIKCHPFKTLIPTSLIVKRLSPDYSRS
jgi:hypothetical protein